MITCYLRYVIDPYKLVEFEQYSRMVMSIPPRFGGQNHGYFLPHEGPNNIAVGLFSFPSLAEYERFRTAIREDEPTLAAWRYAADTRCVLSFERNFMRPIFQA